MYLAEHDVVTEFTPTERAVLFRFTFPENENSYVVVDAFDKGSYIKIIPEQNKIIGYTTRNSGGVPDNFKNYFVIEFDKPFSYQASVADGALVENQSEQTAGHAGAIIGFKTRKGEIVHARVASSFISFEQADRNLKELGSDSFETLVQKGQDAWNQVLGKIEVDGGNLDQYRTFYSCLYRSVLFPRAFFEFDEAGNPVHYSPYIQREDRDGQISPPRITGFVCYRNIPCHQSCFYAADLCRQKPYEPKYKIRADYEHFLWCYYRAKAPMQYLGLTVSSYEGADWEEKSSPQPLIRNPV